MIMKPFYRKVLSRKILDKQASDDRDIGKVSVPKLIAHGSRRRHCDVGKLPRMALTSCLKYIRHVQYGRRVTRVSGKDGRIQECSHCTRRFPHPMIFTKVIA